MNTPSLGSTSYCLHDGVYLGYKDPVSKNRLYNILECTQLNGQWDNGLCTVFTPTRGNINLSDTCKNVPQNSTKCTFNNANKFLGTDNNNNKIVYFQPRQCMDEGGQPIIQFDVKLNRWGDPYDSRPVTMSTCIIPATSDTPSFDMSKECVYSPINYIIENGTNLIRPNNASWLGSGICPNGYNFVIDKDTDTLQCTDGTKTVDTANYNEAGFTEYAPCPNGYKPTMINTVPVCLNGNNKLPVGIYTNDFKIFTPSLL